MLSAWEYYSIIWDEEGFDERVPLYLRDVDDWIEARFKAFDRTGWINSN